MNFRRHAVFIVICLNFLLLFVCSTSMGQENLIEYPKQLPLPALKDGWQRISIPLVGTIDIPPTMEVQSESYKALSGVTINENQFIVQQKGLNELHPGSHKLYVRIMIDTEIDGIGEYETLYSRWHWTEQELEEISKATILQIKREFNAASAEMLKNKSLKLVESFPFTVEEINGMLALCHSYRRQLGNNPIVHCQIYTFQNYDRIHTLTMSYRESEREIWEKDFPAILSSFRITNTQTPLPTAEISDSIMENLFGEYWFLTFLLSAILTWGIGLTPPLLIRYAIIKRPLPKKAAIPLVVLFWFINIVIFTALGSQSKTHGALFLVAWASYYILHKGYTIWQRESMQTNARENLAPKDKNDDTINISQIDNKNNKEILPTAVSSFIEKELNKTVHPKDKSSVTPDSINNQSKNNIKVDTDAPPKVKKIPEEEPPKTAIEPMMHDSIEECTNCDRMIGRLERSYIIKENIVCVKCYQVLNSEND